LLVIYPYYQLKCKDQEFRDVAAALKEVINKNPETGPTLIRLAWHSSGTYSVHSRSHGSNGGTIRHQAELSHGANAGLTDLVKQLSQIHSRFKDRISFADLITLGGVVAVKEMGGGDVNWRYGRVDALESSAPPEGRLPNADLGSPRKTNDHLKDVFGKMGFDDREIVVLSGAHALGRCHPEASGFEGPWTATPHRLNNAYYVMLLNEHWKESKSSKGKFQYNSGSLMMLPSDMALLQDDKFRYWVER